MPASRKYRLEIKYPGDAEPFIFERAANFEFTQQLKAWLLDRLVATDLDITVVALAMKAFDLLIHLKQVEYKFHNDTTILLTTIEE